MPERRMRCIASLDVAQDAVAPDSGRYRSPMACFSVRGRAPLSLGARRLLQEPLRAARARAIAAYAHALAVFAQRIAGYAQLSAG